MAGETVKAPEKKWNPNVKATNIELIETATGKKMDLVPNEQSLPMSQKRMKSTTKDMLKFGDKIIYIEGVLVEIRMTAPPP